MKSCLLAKSSPLRSFIWQTAQSRIPNCLLISNHTKCQVWMLKKIKKDPPNFCTCSPTQSIACLVLSSMNPPCGSVSCIACIGHLHNIQAMCRTQPLQDSSLPQKRGGHHRDQCSPPRVSTLQGQNSHHFTSDVLGYLVPRLPRPARAGSRLESIGRGKGVAKHQRPADVLCFQHPSQKQHTARPYTCRILGCKVLGEKAT